MKVDSSERIKAGWKRRVHKTKVFSHSLFLAFFFLLSLRLSLTFPLASLSFIAESGKRKNEREREREKEDQIHEHERLVSESEEEVEEKKEHQKTAQEGTERKKERNQSQQCFLSITRLLLLLLRHPLELTEVLREFFFCCSRFCPPASLSLPLNSGLPPRQEEEAV
jgi:hypothetical protein